MARMTPDLTLILFSLILIWLSIITFLMARIFRRYYKLTKGSAKDNLGDILEKLSEELKIQEKDLQELMKRSEQTEKEATNHIQKIGLIRFNPFDETGGDQSFALAILDGQDSGIVISGLHSRDNTRLYTKLIKEGKPVKHEFSKEELEAITKAQKQ